MIIQGKWLQNMIIQRKWLMAKHIVFLILKFLNHDIYFTAILSQIPRYQSQHLCMTCKQRFYNEFRLSQARYMLCPSFSI